MRLSHEAISSDIIDMELIELKFIFDRRASIQQFILSSSFIVLFQFTTITETLKFSRITSREPVRSSMSRPCFSTKRKECVNVTHDSHC